MWLWGILTTAPLAVRDVFTCVFINDIQCGNLSVISSVISAQPWAASPSESQFTTMYPESLMMSAAEVVRGDISTKVILGMFFLPYVCLLSYQMRSADRFPVALCLFLLLKSRSLFHLWPQSASCDVAECHSWKAPAVGRLPRYLTRYQHGTRNKKLLNLCPTFAEHLACMPLSAPPVHHNQTDTISFVLPAYLEPKGTASVFTTHAPLTLVSHYTPPGTRLVGLAYWKWSGL